MDYSSNSKIIDFSYTKPAKVTLLKFTAKTHINKNAGCLFSDIKSIFLINLTYIKKFLQVTQQ